jgi:hypothetical protein
MAQRGGNDHDAAASDIESQYGPGHQSAADLLDAHDAAYDLVLQQALLKQVDEPATAALDADDIKPKFGGDIEGYAVRGGRLVVVELKPDGRFEKWHTDIPGVAKKASKAGAQAAAVPSTKEVKEQTATGEADPGAQTPPATGEGDTGSGQAEGDPPKAPKDVTVAKIEAQLEAEGTTPDKDVTKKDDLWALVTPEGQKTLEEAAGTQS